MWSTVQCRPGDLGTWGAPAWSEVKPDQTHYQKHDKPQETRRNIKKPSLDSRFGIYMDLWTLEIPLIYWTGWCLLWPQTVGYWDSLWLGIPVYRYTILSDWGQLHWWLLLVLTTHAMRINSASTECHEARTMKPQTERILKTGEPKSQSWLTFLICFECRRMTFALLLSFPVDVHSAYHGMAGYGYIPISYFDSI